MTSKLPLVTIIYPICEREYTYSVSLKSIFNQTYYNLELIIIDDSRSSKKSLIENIVRRYEIPFSYHRTKGNQGGAITRNIGIQYSKGEYIAFLDSDDLWLPTKIEKQVDLMLNSNNSQLGVVYTKFWMLEYSLQYIYPPNIKYVQGTDRLHFTKQTVCPTSSLLIKASCLETIIFDDRYSAGDDHNLVVNLSLQFDFGLVDEYLWIKINNYGPQVSTNWQKKKNAYLTMMSDMKADPELRTNKILASNILNLYFESTNYSRLSNLLRAGKRKLYLKQLAKMVRLGFVSQAAFYFLTFLEYQLISRKVQHGKLVKFIRRLLYRELFETNFVFKNL